MFHSNAQIEPILLCNVYLNMYRTGCIDNTVEPGVRQSVTEKRILSSIFHPPFLKHASYVINCHVQIIPANPPSNTIPAVSPTGEILYYLYLAMKGNNIRRHSYKKNIKYPQKEKRNLDRACNAISAAWRTFAREILSSCSSFSHFQT